MQKLIVVLGPTASGKSDIAVALAKKYNGEVISADSRQVYKGLDIGTGKITKKEMRGIPHHLLDVASPKKRFSASDFVKKTNKTIVQIVAKGKIPIVCGGTGFYIDALLGDKQIPEVPPNLKLRAELEKKSMEELFKILQKLDPTRASNIDAKNPRRLVRAIEICTAIGKVPKFESRSMNYEVCKIGIKVPDEELKERINKRIDKWFKMGLLKEVRDLHQKGLSWRRMTEIGLEYKIVSLFLQNKISKPEMMEQMQKETWQYAKRQITWFKKDKNIVWILPGIKEIEKEVKKFI
ncbi:MAG: tRNA (adenosine(37)-N6)-dimethylallyltransferase MiaA [Candidatus Paceibacterota bacterium]|jgi:tRNA dimethylallyltransferase